MAEFRFAASFLRELAEWEPVASPRDVEWLEKALAAVAHDPALAGRVPSYYDPALPSYLYRIGPILIHYRVKERGVVEFMNLSFRR